MTDKRTTIVLSIVAAGLLAFILLSERGMLSTSDLEGRRSHVLRTFVRDRITRVELVRGDRKVVFARERREAREDEEEDEAFTDWRIAQPVRAAADQEEVESFLGALEWLMADRTLDGISDADRRRFGLTRPRFIVRYRVGEHTFALRVGRDAPQGEGVYVGLDGEDRAHVVGSDFVESIDHGLDHFRDKSLFPSDFYPSDARQIVLGGLAQRVSLEKTGARWNLREPMRGWANSALVDRIVRLMRDGRVTRFVSESARELSRYGLDRPWRDLTVTRARAAHGQRTGRLRVGGVCGEHHNERYVLSGERGPIVCVLASDLSALDIDLERLRESRLVTIGNDAIENVEVRQGAHRLVLSREDDAWQLASDGGSASAADDAAVAEWLDALRALRAEEFAPLEAAGSHRIDAVTLSIRRSDREETEELRLGENGWVRRGDEPAIVRFGAAVQDLLRPNALRFRSRNVVGAPPGDARQITLRRARVEERAVRGEGGTWQLEAPIRTEADRVLVRELASQVAELSAVRFVAERATAAHGLTAPRIVATVVFRSAQGQARTVTLRIGNSTEGGAFAQLDQGPVFVVADATVNALDTPLLSLDLLTVETEGIQSVRIERAGAPVAELRRAGTAWQTASGPANAQRTAALIDRLGTLRASGIVGYGAPDRALRLDRPAVRITVTQNEASFHLDFGERQGEGEQAFVPARRSDIDAVYRFAPETLAPILTYEP